MINRIVLSLITVVLLGYSNVASARYTQSDPIGLQGGNNTFGYVESNPVSKKDPEGLASVTTDMTKGTTTFDPRPEDPFGIPMQIPTQNVVDRRSLPGANDPFTAPNVVPIPSTDNPRSYGPANSYLDTGDPRGRDIHGGGSCRANNYGDPQADYQGWCATFGCTRAQNVDVQRMSTAIQDFKSRHPNTLIPYTRR